MKWTMLHARIATLAQKVNLSGLNVFWLEALF